MGDAARTTLLKTAAPPNVTHPQVRRAEVRAAHPMASVAIPLRIVTARDQWTSASRPRNHLGDRTATPPVLRVRQPSPNRWNVSGISARGLKRPRVLQTKGIYSTTWTPSKWMHNY